MKDIKKTVIEKRFFIKSETLLKEKGKQYFTVCRTDEFEYVLMIRRLILTKDKIHSEKSKVIKKYKDYYIIEYQYSILVSTLLQVVEELLKLKKL